MGSSKFVPLLLNRENRASFELLCDTAIIMYTILAFLKYSRSHEFILDTTLDNKQFFPRLSSSDTE